MKIFSKKTLLVSSAVMAGMVFAVNTQAVHADTITSDTNTLTVKQNSTIPDKNLISPVASRDSQTLRQVAADNNASLGVLEKLNDISNPDEVIPDGTPLYLPQNENLGSLFGVYMTVDTTVPRGIKAKYYNNLSARERAAKLWIINRESGGNYDARNGKYIGRFQLDRAYLHGNYSKANQERTAPRYVKNRYGSWVAAKRFWLTHHWY